MHFLYDWDRAAAEREFRRAIALEPSSVDAHRWCGSLLSSQARHAGAIAQVKLARDIDPLSVLNGVNVAARLYDACQYDEAIEEALADERMDATFSMAPMVTGWAYAALKDYARAADAHSAIARLDAMAEHGAIISPFQRAEPLLGLGETDKALGLLAQAYDELDLNLVWNFQDSILDRLRDDPRFVALERKLSL